MASSRDTRSDLDFCDEVLRHSVCRSILVASLSPILKSMKCAFTMPLRQWSAIHRVCFATQSDFALLSPFLFVQRRHDQRHRKLISGLVEPSFKNQQEFTSHSPSVNAWLLSGAPLLHKVSTHCVPASLISSRRDPKLRFINRTSGLSDLCLQDNEHTSQPPLLSTGGT